MTTREDELRTSLGRYLSKHWNAPVNIGAMNQIPGGASRAP